MKKEIRAFDYAEHICNSMPKGILLTTKVGDKVKQGQVISKVGTTGNSYGNHLHFEVRIDGVCQNPLDYVKQPK